MSGHFLYQKLSWINYFSKALLLDPEFTCPVHWKAKTETSRFGVRKGLLNEKVTANKMGDLVVPQIYLTRWTKPKVFKKLGEQACMLVGQAVPGDETRKVGGHTATHY